MTLESGRQLQHYRLVEKLGEGGMGVVWKATDTRLDRTVAIKILPQHLAADDDRACERFEREARTISSLNHPRICTLYDIGNQDETRFLVMEFLEGETLAQRLKKGALPLEQALRHGIEIADALNEAHRARIVHRDLKPGNVMLTRQGVKLMDFGLAKIVTRSSVSDSDDISTAEHPLTDAGTLVGTVPYMSPEQLDGKEADAQTDIFALGNVLYEMVTGEPAFTGTTKARLISAIMTGEPTPVSSVQPAAPPLLDHLIGRCLAKSPGDRWRSALDVARELEWIAKPAGPSQPSRAAPDYRIEYFASSDGASIAAARGGKGVPLFVVPSMVGTIETNWPVFARAFRDRDLIIYDRRGTGLSERGSMADGPEPYLHDAQAVVGGLGLDGFDVLGTLLGTTEAAWIVSQNAERVNRLVLRAPTFGLADWAEIPGVRAALAAMEQDWEFFTESFAQFVVGWGSPNGPQVAAQLRAMTSREELRALIEALKQLDLAGVYEQIRVPTLVEHHPEYFFPDTYSRQIASMIRECRMAIYSGKANEFLADLSIARAFLGDG